jgi:hypothetical protein
MTVLQSLPVLALLATVVAIFRVAARPGGADRGAWVWPVVFGALFAAFSAVTVLREGVVQFWVNHTTTLAGNQVWFDLLIAVAISFTLIAPRARAVGMPLWPWAFATVLTASIALLPMLARLLWLEQAARGRDG